MFSKSLKGLTIFFFYQCCFSSTKENGITKGTVISYAAQIAEGMMFLHSKVSQKPVKTDNICSRKMYNKSLHRLDLVVDNCFLSVTKCYRELKNAVCEMSCRQLNVNFLVKKNKPIITRRNNSLGIV